MNLGAMGTLVTLDVPNGETGDYLPLDPPTWWVAVPSEVSGQITLRGHYRSDINTATRIQFKGKTFHVDSPVNRDERNTELIVTCREVFS
jgi:hypothetical protein